MGSTGTARNGGGLYAAADAEMMDSETPADLAKPVKDIEDKWKLLPRQVLFLLLLRIFALCVSYKIYMIDNMYFLVMLQLP